MRTACLGIAAVTTFLTLAVTGTAWAHVEISPSQVPAGEAREYTVEVPTEKDIPTTEVELRVPDGFEVSSVESPAGWQGDTSGTSIVWSGGEIPEDEAQEFTFEARAPEGAGEFAFDALQTYQDGSVVRWDGAPDSEEPAPVVTVGGRASGEDEHSHLPDSGGMSPGALYGLLGAAATGFGILMLLAIRRLV